MNTIYITDENHHFDGYDPKHKYNVWQRDGGHFTLIDAGDHLGVIRAYYIKRGKTVIVKRGK